MEKWDRTVGLGRRSQTLLVLFFALLLGSGAAFAQPSFTQSISSSTIGPGSVATVAFTISNGDGTPVDEMAFVDTLPAGMTVATPAAVDSSCGGTVTATGGSASISLSDGVLGPGSSCSISVNVTAGAAGSYVNTTGDLTSSGGNSGTSSATLTVDANYVGFSKSFSPSTVFFNGRSTLTFTIDNTASGTQTTNLRITDNLPAGMTVASPSNATTTCTGGAITAAPGSSVISYAPVAGITDASVAAGSTCTVSADVIGGSVGSLENVSDDINAFSFTTFQNYVGGKASATLDVAFERLRLIKSFTDDPVKPGDPVTLEFTILNIDRGESVTGISFSDDLDATLSGLVASSLPSTPCGAGSQITGTSTITLTGASLAPESSCTFSVGVAVPSSATPGTYPNTTSPITGTASSGPVSGNPGSDVLVVSAAPSLAKTFLTNPVGAGATVDMEFTITNTSPTFAATDITFTDSLGFLSGASVSSLPANGFCGGSSAIFQAIVDDSPQLSVLNASLAAGASCTFTVGMQVPSGAASGNFTSVTSEVSATINGETNVGAAASDTLGVVGSLEFGKEFIDDPVAPGDTATLRFTISHGEEAIADAEAITFSDDLTATLAGLEAVGLPATGICGAASQITGTTNLSFTGGSLAPGESCFIDVTVTVPAGATPGSYTNTASSLMATVSGVTTTSIGPSDDLDIAGLAFSMEFTDDPVIAGAQVNLRYTIENLSATFDATDMVFTQNLGQAVSGLAASGLPLSDVCGTGSQISGTGFLIFSGGNLTAGNSCTIDVTVDVPSSADSGLYHSSTSNLSATIGGGSVVFDAAGDALEVSSELLGFTKEFLDDPVGPGDLVTLEFTLDNMADDTATDLAFTDDLDAALADLASVSGTLTDVCGAGSEISGTSTLTFTGGSLAAGASCSFSVSLLVPAGANPGTEVTNVTSELAGTVTGLTVTGPPAIADLELNSLTFAKAFDDSTIAGGTVELTFTLENPGASETVDRVGFTDDLDAMLAGAVATGLPVLDVCGEGSVLDGTSAITLTDATLLPGATCTFSVTVSTPSEAEPGDYLNVTEAVTSNGLQAASPAEATLTIDDGCSIRDDFDDGIVDPAWSFAGVGNANQLALAEEDGVMKLTADGATAFYGADNAGFLYRTYTGDFRMEVTIDGNPMTTGGEYRKSGLMVRASLDKWDIRLLAFLVPFWEDTNETHLQFVARESFGTPGRLPVARDVIGVPRVVRLAVERVGQVLAVEYSIDDGETWIRPTTGLGGSILIDELPETLLIGAAMVSNNISVTSTSHLDDFLVCAPGEQPGGLPTPTPPPTGRQFRR